VEACFTRIAGDARHLDVRRLLHGPAPARLFEGWAMRDDPARSWLWSAAQVADGAVERASEAEITAVFQRVAADTGVDGGDGSPRLTSPSCPGRP
jgi:hypothetical protein